MKVVSKMKNFVLKPRIFVLKTKCFELKMMTFAGAGRYAGGAGPFLRDYLELQNNRSFLIENHRFYGAIPRYRCVSGRKFQMKLSFTLQFAVMSIHTAAKRFFERLRVCS